MNNIQHLRYAVEVEKTGSISRAAENLFMGQPHLSKAIRELEEDMNITIFTRTPRGVAVTPQGERFLEYARNILAQVDELEALYRPSGAQSFSLSLPRASYAAFAFTEFVRELDGADGIDVKYLETNSMQTIREVAEGNCGLGIVRFQIQHEKYFLPAITERGLKHENIWDFEYLALMSRAHPLAGHESIKYSELRHYTEIVHDDNSVPAMPVSEARLLAQEHEKKKKIAVYERGIQFELLRQAPTTYIWVSPVPRDMLDRFSLVQRPCADADNRSRDILVWRGNYKFTKEDELFIEKLRETVRKLSTD